MDLSFHHNIVSRTALRLGLTAVFIVCLGGTMFGQIGEHRNRLSVGVTGGYNLNRIKFLPKVEQNYKGGLLGGVAMRYTVEKYFSTIASIYGEVNFSQLGWKESILDVNNQPVINGATGVAEEYSRTINYVQVPLLTHLAWGREEKGMSFFVTAGPQFGYYINERTQINFDFSKMNLSDRASQVIAQDTMRVANKFDYGIAVGLGLEYSMRGVGHFLLEGRYYYGLNNMYGDTKRDYFGTSNHNTITIKLTYLFDVIRK